ncbi:MAG TPA: acyl-CoA carboxylase subunit beta [Candidatus Limiplasma sp.]|mgnify:CR=1 FL=1|nr:acyl-CoA carboxylase subunit beta [Candidatus Limiplasma sp.]
MNYDLEKQHKKGKLHAIERINLLVDAGTFMEIGQSITHQCHDFGMDQIETPYDGVITGIGLVEGRQVGVYAQDFTIMGGSLGREHGKKIARLIDICITSRCPVVGINDSGGARIQEGVGSLASYGDIFYQNTRASGYIPQISVIAGPCAGGAVYSPGLTDFVFVIDNISKMFVTGPKVVKRVMNEDVTDEQLGGAEMHARTSGVAHFISKDEKECFAQIKKLLKSIPHSRFESSWTDRDVKAMKKKCEIADILPKEDTKGYDVRDIINEVFDKGSFVEVHQSFAQNAVVGLAKLSGVRVGIVANQPKIMGGVLDTNASDKVARFIRYCDAYEIPLVTLVDVPGYLPGTGEETKGIIRHGAKVLYAYSEANVPKLTLVMRKAYGGAYIAMCSKHLGADYVFAWPRAEIAVMGGPGAVDILYSKEMAKAADPNAIRQQKLEEYNAKFLSPDVAAQNGYVDEVIQMDQTRDRLFMALWSLRNKKSTDIIDKKHGNIPL